MEKPSISEALLAHLSLLGELSGEDERAILSVQGEVRSVRRHEDILSAGSRPSASVVVLSGFLHRYSTRRDGSRQIHSFYLPTDAPALEALHIDYLDNSLGAVVDSTVGLIAHDDLHRLMKDSPNLLTLIWRESLIQGAVFREWLMRNSRLPADASMAHLFCEIHTRSRAAGLTEDNACSMPVTQEMLADALGLTAVHVNRTLQTLRETETVELKGGRLFVHDFCGLSRIADFDPYYLHLRRSASRRTAA